MTSALQGGPDFLNVSVILGRSHFHLSDGQIKFERLRDPINRGPRRRALKAFHHAPYWTEAELHMQRRNNFTS